MQTILITGAGRGIGLATAQKFLENDCIVYACSRNLKAIHDLEVKYPNCCIPVFLDLEQDETIEKLSARLTEDGVTLNYVLHNAGYLVNQSFTTIPKEELERSYRVNCMAPFLLTQKIMPSLSTNAHVVMISSMGGFQGSVKFPGLTAYSSSKAAAASLMECLQAEYANTDMAFNSLCIGAVQTEMLANAFPEYIAPLTPEQMAAFIYQFLTTSGQFIRGKVIPVSLSTP